MDLSAVDFEERQITLLDQTFQIRVSDDNVVEKFIDFKAIQSEWHEKKIGIYHFSQLIRCLRAYYLQFEFGDIVEISLAQEGVYFIGHLDHKVIQDFIEQKYGFAINERPLIDEVNKEITLIGKADIIDVKRLNLIDIKTKSYMPILTDIAEDEFEEKFGENFLQVLAYGYFLNHTYFKIEPLERLYILYINKMTFEMKVIEIPYNDEISEYFYLKVRERAKYLHECLKKKEIPDQFKVSKNCQYCPFSEYKQYCPEGYKKALSLTPTENYESIEYKKKYGKNKRPYWRFDEDNERWLKSKDFKRFLSEELGYSDKKIREL
jgi:hypothetical protein